MKFNSVASLALLIILWQGYVRGEGTFRILYEPTAPKRGFGPMNPSKDAPRLIIEINQGPDAFGNEAWVDQTGSYSPKLFDALYEALLQIGKERVKDGK